MKRYDEHEIRCPRLGHDVSFAYCRREAADLPCHRLEKCWSVFLPAEAWLREVFSPDDLARYRSQVPKEKMASLLDLIEQARKRRKESGHDDE